MRARFDPVAGNPLQRSLCRGREMQARVRFVRCSCNSLRRSCVSSARNAGESAICPVPAQPSAEIVRVERAKIMQARVRFVPCARNPLRRSCVSNPLWRSCASRARNAGESAFWIWRGQPSAEIVRVEGAKCRLECVLARSGATLCGDRACRLCSTTLVRGELEDENWRLCSTTLVRGAICGAGS